MTAILNESRLKITTPPDLPSGDVVELEGEREYGTRIEWTLTADQRLPVVEQLALKAVVTTLLQLLVRAVKKG